MQKCKYCQKEKTLIKAHILPRNFFTNYKKVGFWGVEPHKIDKRHFQSGVIDKNILCSECDNAILGKYDNEAYRLLLDIENKKSKTKWRNLDAYIYYSDEYNYEYLRKFFIAFLWKASISDLYCMNMVDLGPYEKIALGLLKDEIIDNNLFKTIIFKTKKDEFEGVHTIKCYKNFLGQSRCYSVYFDAYMVWIFVKYKKFPTEYRLFEELIMDKNQVVIIETDIINKIRFNVLSEFKRFI